MDLATAYLTMMLRYSPPATVTSRQTYAENVETAEERTQRYVNIAQAVADVVLDRDEEPLFSGRYGREKTGRLILAVFERESGWHKHVQLGLGKHSRGDGGKSWCLGQHMLGDSGKTPEGWTGAELVADLNKCVVATLHRMRSSMQQCRSGSEVTEGLASYASGSCNNAAGRGASTGLFNSAQFMRKIMPMVDDEFMVPRDRKKDD